MFNKDDESELIARAAIATYTDHFNPLGEFTKAGEPKKRAPLDTIISRAIKILKKKLTSYDLSDLCDCIK